MISIKFLPTVLLLNRFFFKIMRIKEVIANLMSLIVKGIILVIEMYGDFVPSRHLHVVQVPRPVHQRAELL